MRRDKSKKVYQRFRQFGGYKVFWQYVKMGLLSCLAKDALKLLMGKMGPEEVYADIANKVSPRLLKKYEPLIFEKKTEYDEASLRHHHEPVIWFCWLQGMDGAPDLVKACYKSIKCHIKDKEIKVVTYENYREWVDIPDFIIRKFDKRQMPPALFSDILRLELLIKYGGTWMDATVLCTGNDYPKEVMDGDLFLFQHIRRNDRRFYGVSNWFITACSNHKVLLILRDVLYQYWKDYSCTVQYYIFHLFFNKIASLYPQEIAAMPRGNRLFALRLAEKLNQPYEDQTMEELTKRSCFHKLNYRAVNGKKADGDTFYSEIIRRYS